MAGTFKFELVTPERMLLSEDATQVVVPGVEGEFTVLAGHAPLVSALRPGVIDATLGDSRKVRLIVHAERALDLQAIDPASIASELQTAEAELAAATTDAARLAANSAVYRL